MAKILKNVKLVIFDVDGVIFDIIDAIREVVQEGIDKYGLKVSLQDAMQEVAHLLEVVQSIPFPRIILNSYDLLDIDMLKEYTLIKKLRIGASFYSNFRQKKAQCALFPGIAAIIKGLHKSNYKLAILSNNKQSYVIEALDKESLTNYFDLIYGFNEVSQTKPDPEGLLKLMDALHVTPEETIFIGDMVSDIQAAHNAKIKSIAVASGLVSKEKLVASNPTVLVDNTQELRQELGI